MSEVELKKCPRVYLSEEETRLLRVLEREKQHIREAVWQDENGRLYRLDIDRMPSPEELAALAALQQTAYLRSIRTAVCAGLFVLVLLALVVTICFLFLIGK